MTEWLLVGLGTLVTFTFIYAAHNFEHGWRSNLAGAFGGLLMATGGYFSHSFTLGLANGILLSLLGFTMWVQSQPYREHIRRQIKNGEIEVRE